MIEVFHGQKFAMNSGLQPVWMFHEEGNFEEGAGIYFADEISVADGYSDKKSEHIYKAIIDETKLVNSRGFMDEEIGTDKIHLILKDLHEKDAEPLYYYLTDYGVELSEPDEVEDYHLEMLADNLGSLEVRNFQIDMSQRFSGVDFVDSWRKVLPDVIGTVNSDRGFYALLDTDIKVEKVGQKKAQKKEVNRSPKQ